MPDTSDFTKSVISEEERKKLIQEISRIKDVLESFKYGLNFEQFADEIFKTIDRQTLAIKKLDEKMSDIIKHMERLEERLNEGITVRVSSLTDSATGSIAEGKEVVIEGAPEEVGSDDAQDTQVESDDLAQEKAELESKIARLFEKENNLLEMVLNDPAGAEEYEDNVRVIREMRTELEGRLKQIKEQLM
jgi:hypothetical protein